MGLVLEDLFLQSNSWGVSWFVGPIVGCQCGSKKDLRVTGLEGFSTLFPSMKKLFSWTIYFIHSNFTLKEKIEILKWKCLEHIKKISTKLINHVLQRERITYSFQVAWVREEMNSPKITLLARFYLEGSYFDQLPNQRTANVLWRLIFILWHVIFWSLNFYLCVHSILVWILNFQK